MGLEREQRLSRAAIRAYGHASVTVDGQCYRHSIVVASSGLVFPWYACGNDRGLTQETKPSCLPSAPQAEESSTRRYVLTAADLSAKTIESLLQLNPKLLLIGTGVRYQPLTGAVIRACASAALPFEAMSTAAACRTYCAVADAHTNVVAALMLAEQA